MQTFADWLCYYNDLDVAPGLEAFEKMRAFYTDKGMDVMKDAVSLRSELAFSLERHDGARGWTFSPSKEVYAVLKEAVVGGSDTYKTAPQAKTVCKRIIFYDANVLYLSTMLGEMPCAKERVMHYRNSAGLAPMLTERLKARTWFESAEVDIENPEQLWLEFKEMPPFFVTNHIPDEAEPQHMKDYLRRTGRKKGDGKTLFGALSVKKLLLYAPMLRWYVEHGVVIKTIDRTIDYQVTKIFTWFVEQVTEAQRTRDVGRSKAALAEVFKQLGNSDYGKLIEALERQTGVIYTLDEAVDRSLRSAYFRELKELGQAN